MSKLEGHEALPSVIHGKENETDRAAKPVKVDADGKIIISALGVGFEIPEYDELVLSYTGTLLTGVVYKLATVTQATLTLSYTGTLLTGVVKS